MKKSVPIPIRLDPEVWERYSAEASALDMGLSTYLRQRLQKSDELLGELAALRRAVERATATVAAPAPAAPAVSPGTLIEILLLLRSLVGPQKATVAQKEVERRGYESWS
jgi:hypothetical protein